MGKRFRQYAGLLAAVAIYYLIHEGAHLAVALTQGVFKQINIIGLGIQIDVFAERMSDTQMGVFCLAGAVATLCTGWLLTCAVRPICRIRSKMVRTCAWYTSVTLLMLDPIYLGIFYRWVGGGDMNGISLLLPAAAVSAIAIALGILNALLIWRVLYPAYTQSFADQKA